MNNVSNRVFRALIAEDEPILAATLDHTLRRLWPQLEVVAICPNGIVALQQALALQPDIVFLDIKMPGMSGLEAAEGLAEDWPPGKPFPLVVFVTAYEEFALAAFKHAAADYVLKPVTDARLSQTVERLQLRLASSSALPAPLAAQTVAAPADQTAQSDHLASLLSQLRALIPEANQTSEHLTVIRAAVGNQVRMIPVGDVAYFEAVDKYVNVVAREGEYLIRTSLRELVPQLDPKQFWQIHRGTIVNVGQVASTVRDEYGKLSIILRDRTEKVRVSPLYAHLFRQM